MQHRKNTGCPAEHPHSVTTFVYLYALPAFKMRLLCFLLCIILSSAQDYSWYRLHTAQSADELRDVVDDYVESFPCEECRIHFEELVDKHPFPLEEVRSVEEARIWSWLTHNIVNKRLGETWKPFDIMYTYIKV